MLPLIITVFDQNKDSANLKYLLTEHIYLDKGIIIGGFDFALLNKTNLYWVIIYQTCPSGEANHDDSAKEISIVSISFDDRSN